MNVKCEVNYMAPHILAKQEQVVRITYISRMRVVTINIISMQLSLLHRQGTNQCQHGCDVNDCGLQMNNRDSYRIGVARHSAHQGYCDSVTKLRLFDTYVISTAFSYSWCAYKWTSFSHSGHIWTDKDTIIPIAMQIWQLTALEYILINLHFLRDAKLFWKSIHISADLNL